MVGILIRTRTGLEVFGTNTRIEETAMPAAAPGDALEVEFAFDCSLTPQEYTLTVATQHPSGHSHDWLDDVISFRVVDAKARAGVANLPVEVQVRANPPA
jgi:lipopolysaccharide transport system ATP-binding protein